MDPYISQMAFLWIERLDDFHFNTMSFKMYIEKKYWVAFKYAIGNIQPKADMDLLYLNLKGQK